MSKIKYIIIPGKFRYHDAIKITKMLNNGYRIPTVPEAVQVIKENDYLLGSKTVITNEAQEFGEEGNWIFVAHKYTELKETMLNTKQGYKEGYLPNYKREPVRNALYDLLLIK